jgi:glycosyltransferase involved in cell wall biosynthesis
VKNTPVVTIVLPAFNEELTLEKTILSFHKVVPSANIVIVDNNSKDRTHEIARRVLGENSIGGGVLFEPRQGKGFAVRRAFQEIESDIYVLADADLTYPAEALPNLLEAVVVHGYDMCVGSRLTNESYKKENKRAFHYLGNHLVRWLINKLFSASLQDIMSGYRVFSRRFVKALPILSAGFQVETEITLHALDKRLLIKELPIEYRDRPEGSFSKLNTYRDGVRVIVTIFNIFRYYRPYLFFSVIGGFFLVLCLLAGFPVVAEFIQTQYIRRVPLAILATGLALSSALSFAIGTILDAFARQSRVDFELRFLSHEK